MWVRVFNLHFPDKMKSRRHKEREKPRHDEILSPQEIPASDPRLVPSRKYPADSAEEPFSEGSFSQWEKGLHNCKSRGDEFYKRVGISVIFLD